jgi:sulfur transfer complex TusBCD TusB component (DsrH family)
MQIRNIKFVFKNKKAKVEYDHKKFTLYLCTFGLALLLTDKGITNAMKFDDYFRIFGI